MDSVPLPVRHTERISSILLPFSRSVVERSPLAGCRRRAERLSIFRARIDRRERRSARIRKKEKRPRISPACCPGERSPARRGDLSAGIAESGAIEFKSASPSGKMIRSALIAANSSFVTSGTLFPSR